jgi:hypothetical protein
VWSRCALGTVIVLTVIAVAIYAARFRTLPNPILLVGTVYWGGLNVVLLSSFITRSWHGFARAGEGFAPAAPDAEPQAARTI